MGICQSMICGEMMTSQRMLKMELGKGTRRGRGGSRGLLPGRRQDRDRDQGRRKDLENPDRAAHPTVPSLEAGLAVVESLAEVPRGLGHRPTAAAVDLGQDPDLEGRNDVLGENRGDPPPHPTVTRLAPDPGPAPGIGQGFSIDLPFSGNYFCSHDYIKIRLKIVLLQGQEEMIAEKWNHQEEKKISFKLVILLGVGKVSLK